jgi:hypothetical protein
MERMLRFPSVGGRVACDARKQSNAHRGIEQEICWHWQTAGCSRAPQAAHPPADGCLGALVIIRPQ